MNDNCVPVLAFLIATAGLGLTACSNVHQKSARVGTTPASTLDDEEEQTTPSGNVAFSGRIAAACPPGAPIGDEPAEIQALSESIRGKYLVSDCPLTGCGTTAEKEASNRRKNWLKIPSPQDIDPTITLDALMALSDDDRSRWTPDVAATVEGYVRDVKHGGTESVNCRADDPAIIDTHIELSLTPNEPLKTPNIFVVEVTPRMRAVMAANGEKWGTDDLQYLKGKHVRFTGWLFFDADHCANSSNTIGQAGPGCIGPGGTVWRRTAWELHPITSFNVQQDP